MSNVVVSGGGGDSGAGAGLGLIAGILIVILAIAFAIWYFGFNAGNPSHPTNVNVAPPQINVYSPSS